MMHTNQLLKRMMFNSNELIEKFMMIKGYLQMAEINQSLSEMYLYAESEVEKKN